MSLAVAGMILSASPVKAQVLYGSIVGNVKDAQGAVVPGATVTITNKQTGLTRDSVTDDQGSYTLTNVLPGPYDVKVSLTGFREAVRANVPVTIGQISRVDLTLEVGALTEVVNVESAAELLQTDKADVHTELKSAEITAMPLNQFRNYQALLNLVPGASPARFNNAETDTPARSLTTYVNGQSSYQNTTRTDGAANVNIWLPNHLMYVAPAETIDTVNVATNNFDAEQGMAGGACDNGRDQVRDQPGQGLGVRVPQQRELQRHAVLLRNAARRQAGKAAGHPQHLRWHRRRSNHQEQALLLRIVRGLQEHAEPFPELQRARRAALRTGDFSNARNTDGSLQIIYDPSTGNADGTGRHAVPGQQSSRPAGSTRSRRS